MGNQRVVEIAVGSLVVAAVVALFVLAVKVSGFSMYTPQNAFMVKAEFDNIGGLKVRAPVVIAGVRVGEVYGIDLNADSFKATVSFLIDNKQTQIPADSTARILTHGLLGSNYIGITPGFGEPVEEGGSAFLQEGSQISDTQPAVILENLIGHLIFGDSNKEENQ